jgi:hypothetical protein
MKTRKFFQVQVEDPGLWAGEEEDSNRRNPDTMGISRTSPPQVDKNSSLPQRLGKLVVFVQALSNEGDMALQQNENVTQIEAYLAAIFPLGQWGLSKFHIAQGCLWYFLETGFRLIMPIEGARALDQSTCLDENEYAGSMMRKKRLMMFQVLLCLLGWRF